MSIAQNAQPERPGARSQQTPRDHEQDLVEAGDIRRAPWSFAPKDDSVANAPGEPCGRADAAPA